MRLFYNMVLSYIVKVLMTAFGCIHTLTDMISYIPRLLVFFFFKFQNAMKQLIEIVVKYVLKDDHPGAVFQKPKVS